MFTGLVEHTGRVAAIEPIPFGASLWIDASGWSHEPDLGASIAVNGCCLTVAERAGGRLRFDVVRQTLDHTTIGSLADGARVNLEHAATPTTLLGGHVVQGHVDGVGTVVRVDADERSWRVRIEPPRELVECIVERGSIAVDGVSLTVASIGPSGDPAPRPEWFEVALIPTTLRLTTLGDRTAGSRVNLETDCMVRAVVHWLRLQRLDHAPNVP